jgi:phosphatidylglycerol---prolipoprotein diacylglyceryl transferase
MLPVLNIGPLALPAPELFLILGFWLALELTEKQAPRFRVDATQLYNLTLIALLAGLIGARLAYAARAPSAFLNSPLNLLALTPQMMDATGGLIIAAAAALIYGQIRRMALWPTLDALTTLLSVLAVVIGLANFASGSAFGAPTQVPWAIELWGETRHPTQVYQTLAALLIAILVWPGSRVARYTLRGPETSGTRFWVFLALSAAAHLIIETFRGDSILLLGSFRQGQVIAWAALAVSLWQIGQRIRSQPPLPSEPASPPQEEPPPA